MTVNDRKCATFVAATALSLSFFATCASSSHAALRSDRPPVSVLLALHGREGVVRTQAATVGDLLKIQSIALDPRDEVSPAPHKTPHAHDTIRVITWTAHMR